MKEQKGITLIALVITIAIMLVLVSVTITILVNENIIGKADDAAELTKEAQERESEESKKFNIKGNTYNNLQDYVENIERKKDIDDIIKDALENRIGQEAIGIGTDGSTVNMEYWYYSIYEGKMVLGNACPYASGGRDHPGYIGPIVDGKIVGAVPQYIIPEGEEQCYEVMILGNTFVDINNLVVAPELPSGVIDMPYTFKNCTGLRVASAIPKNVDTMYSTFENCSSLTEPPAIPKKVTKMIETFRECTSLTRTPDIPYGVYSLEKTFYECINLKTASPIPASVEILSSTFFNCRSLTGTLEINSPYSLISYDYCLSGAATNANASLLLTGTCGKIPQIYTTRSSDSHITM